LALQSVPVVIEVGEEVRGMFQKEGFSEKVFTNKSGSVCLDLAEANRELLTAEGVDHVYDAGFCTFCKNDVFASYRRGDHSVRQINFVSLKG
jgi:copper oxidase (laccase) domain-containing protein